MKNPPTLADACVATALDKKCDPKERALLLKVNEARKFVLDKNMSAYFYDLSHGFWRGGLRKRDAAAENLRRLARLPHRTTWIEFDSNAYFERAKGQGASVELIKAPGGASELPSRMGWLVQQHPAIETAFKAIEVTAGSGDIGSYLRPIGFAWCSDDTPLPWLGCETEHPIDILVGFDRYRTKQVKWVHSISQAYGVDAASAARDVASRKAAAATKKKQQTTRTTPEPALTPEIVSEPPPPKRLAGLSDLREAAKRRKAAMA